MARRIPQLLLCCLSAALLACELAGCESAAAIEGRERVAFDKQVDTEWKKNWNWVEGLQFLEKGGLYLDTGEPGDPAYDRPAILPLLKRLSKSHGLKWHAVVDKKKRSFAVAVVGQLPEDEQSRRAIMDTLNEEQKTFPLDILVQQGNRWLSLDFLTPEDSAFLDDDPEPGK